jgi:signal transduction histidine kinase
MASMRARVLMGAVLWTVGIFATIVITFSRNTHLRSAALLHTHAAFVTMVAVGSLIAGLALVRGAIAPFDRIRARLWDVRRGNERHLEGRYPSEVQPVVDDLNALLDHRDEAVRRALAKAGDLAHGLKTPLAVLAQEAERARACGHTEIADTISQQVERMRRQMDYHLAHARAAASGAMRGARCSVLESADGLARTLRRLYAERGVTIDLQADSTHVVRAGREDLDEMLGNLLDNACKWARGSVRVSSGENGSTITIAVEDDGPGLDPSLRQAVLLRGVRADEAAPGSGFGLAIVHDLAELYGGSIALDGSSLGGLRATLRLPAS